MPATFDPAMLDSIKASDVSADLSQLPAEVRQVILQQFGMFTQATVKQFLSMLEKNAKS